MSGAVPLLGEDAAETPTGRRGQVAWAFFEFAQAPAMTLIFMFVFATYFSQTLVGDPVRGQTLWSLAATITGLFVALIAPIVGAAADRMGHRKPWLFAALLVSTAACALLWFAVPTGGIPLVAVFVLIVTIGVAKEAEVTLHSAILASIARPAQTGMLSGLGFACGNAGSFITMVFYLFAIALPAMQIVDWAILPSAPAFGLDPAANEHARFVGPFGAAWALLFAAPLFLWTPDRPSTGVRFAVAVREGLADLFRTIRDARRHANVARFLLARMIYNDGIIALQGYCAIYASGIFGWDLAAVLIFGLLVAGCCLFGSLVAGWVDTRIGSRRATIASLIATAVLLIVSISFTPGEILFMPYDAGGAVWGFPYFRTLPELLFLGSFLCLGISATVALVSARAMLAKIAPRAQMTQFFGLFAFSGRATAFLGHGAVALMTTLFVSQRAGFIAPLGLLIAGLLILLTVREQRESD